MPLNSVVQAPGTIGDGELPVPARDLRNADFLTLTSLCFNKSFCQMHCPKLQLQAHHSFKNLSLSCMTCLFENLYTDITLGSQPPYQHTPIAQLTQMPSWSREARRNDI